jgi:hypothetical protein
MGQLGKHALIGGIQVGPVGRGAGAYRVIGLVPSL